MKDFEVKNCGCNQDPCKTYGSEEEQKAEYEDLKETKLKKPSMESLLNDWRKVLKEHITDEEHEHPHVDESDEDHCDESDETIEEMIQRVSKEVLP